MCGLLDPKGLGPIDSVTRSGIRGLCSSLFFVWTAFVLCPPPPAVARGARCQAGLGQHSAQDERLGERLLGISLSHLRIASKRGLLPGHHCPGIFSDLLWMGQLRCRCHCNSVIQFFARACSRWTASRTDFDVFAVRECTFCSASLLLRRSASRSARGAARSRMMAASSWRSRWCSRRCRAAPATWMRGRAPWLLTWRRNRSSCSRHWLGSVSFSQQLHHI